MNGEIEVMVYSALMVKFAYKISLCLVTMVMMFFFFYYSFVLLLSYSFNEKMYALKLFLSLHVNKNLVYRMLRSSK